MDRRQFVRTTTAAVGGLSFVGQPRFARAQPSGQNRHPDPHAPPAPDYRQLPHEPRQFSFHPWYKLPGPQS